MMLSIVIPAKDEAESLPSVLSELQAVMAQLPAATEVIIVDDHSSDGTPALKARFPFVRMIKNSYNSGKGRALRVGFEAASGEYIAMMDADFSHQAQDLPALFKEAQRHRGLVVGSRILGGSAEYTPVRAFGNIMLTKALGIVHGQNLTDVLNGYKIFHRDVFHQFVYTSEKFEIEIELLINALRLGRPVTEYPSHERSRLAGKLKSSVVKHGTLFMSRIIYEKFRKAARRHV